MRKDPYNMILREAIDEMNHWLITQWIVAKKKDGSKETINLNSEIGEKLCLALLKETKQPHIYVNIKGKVFFSEVAKKYAIESEIQDAIELLMGFKILTPPLYICLTDSTKELAEMAPDLEVFYLRGIAYKDKLR